MDSPGLKTIFCEALARQGSPERAAYLDEACEGDAVLRAQVEALLGDHERIGRFLGTAPGSIASSGETAGEEPGDPQPGDTMQAEAPDMGAATSAGPGSEDPGAVIGPYKLVQSIGEGGMGTVYMAEQARPVRRTVALKLIRAGMDSRQVLARFEAERQALALMDHPSIARVLDAGTSGTGRPFFVMELVKGVPITRFCDERRLTLRERLELAIPVCQAVQHAHQKGIIHRDLKPSNILIALYDGKPVPKVIDFGVAKATGPRLTDQTLHTEFGAVVGTLEYMSPEQAELNQLDIDTRSDIYSLGVLVYELLTGSTPMERKRLKAAAFHEVLRVIREDETPRPSLRLSSTEELPGIAACRQVEPRKLSGLVRGELDWIVMKALEKDRNRRYETANALAADLQCYLDDEPVRACPPSGWYRLRKFVRRNKTRLVMTGLIILCLVLIGGGGGWVAGDRAARRARAAEGFDEALREAGASLQEDNEPAARAAAQRAAGLLAGIGGDAILQRRLKHLQGDLEMVGKMEWARLQRADLKHGHFDGARSDSAYAEAFRAYNLPVLELEPEEAARRIALSAIREQLLAALVDWANISADRPDYQKLKALIRLADRDPWRQQRFDATDRNDQAELVRLSREPAAVSQPPARLAALGDLLARFDLPAAVDFLGRAQQRHPDDFWINHQLGLYLKSSTPPRLDEAIGFYRAAVAVRRESPGAHFNLGNALRARARPVEAEAEYREAIRLKPDYSDAHGSLGGILNDHKGDHDGAIAAFSEAIRFNPDDAFVRAHLAGALQAKGLLDEAAAISREAIRLKPDLAVGHNNLGRALSAKGQHDDAIAAFREAIRLDRDFAHAHHNLGLSLCVKGRTDEALGAVKESVRLAPNYGDALLTLGTVLCDAKGDYDGAIAAFAQVIRLVPENAVGHRNMGNALWHKGRLDDAIAAYKEAIRLEPQASIGHQQLGNVLKVKGRLDEAITAYKEAVRLNPREHDYRECLGNALAAKDRMDEAIVELEQAIRLKPDCVNARNNLGIALRRKGRNDEAIRELSEAIRLKPDFAFAHVSLGNAQRAKGRLDDAIAAYREAVRLQPDLAAGHHALGIALVDKGRSGEAIVAFKQAVRLQPDHAEAHCNLGGELLKSGQFRQAVEEFRLGHKLGSRTASWSYPSERWLRDAERQADLDARLPRILEGKDQPADAGERLAVARICQLHKKFYAASAHWYGQAFAAQSALAEDLRSGNRYNAACAAALAGCGLGQDAPGLHENDRGPLRRQALDWLRADLAAWSRLLEGDRAKAAPVVRQQMQHWLADPDFAGVRGGALAKLPEAERQPWQELWTDVGKTLAELRDMARETKAVK